MMKESTRIDPLIAEAIKRLRASGKFVIAALTNNFSPPTTTSSVDGKGSAPSLDEELKHLGLDKGTALIKSYFDHYIESAVVGMRYVGRAVWCRVELYRHHFYLQEA